VEAAAFPPVVKAEVSEPSLNALQSFLLETIGEDALLLQKEATASVSAIPKILDWDALRAFITLASIEDASCPSELLGIEFCL
jgi:hypothetical protein